MSSDAARTRPASEPIPVGPRRLQIAQDTEAARLDQAASRSELQTRQGFGRVSSVAFGAWMVMDGALFVASGPERLTSPVFVYASEVVPYWPLPFAAVISAGGLGLVYAAVMVRLLVGCISCLVISAWQFVYCLMLFRAIADPLPPPARPVAYPPIADHGALSAIAFLTGLMLLRLWRRHGHIRRLDHAT